VLRDRAGRDGNSGRGSAVTARTGRLNGAADPVGLARVHVDPSNYSENLKSIAPRMRVRTSFIKLLPSTASRAGTRPFRSSTASMTQFDGLACRDATVSGGALTAMLFTAMLFTARVVTVSQNRACRRLHKPQKKPRPIQGPFRAKESGPPKIWHPPDLPLQLSQLPPPHRARAKA
jgi:hypothetical protein